MLMSDAKPTHRKVKVRDEWSTRRTSKKTVLGIGKMIAVGRRTRQAGSTGESRPESGSSGERDVVLLLIYAIRTLYLPCPEVCQSCRLVRTGKTRRQ